MGILRGFDSAVEVAKEEQTVRTNKGSRRRIRRSSTQRTSARHSFSQLSVAVVLLCLDSSLRSHAFVAPDFHRSAPPSLVPRRILDLTATRVPTSMTTSEDKNSTEARIPKDDSDTVGVSLNYVGELRDSVSPSRAIDIIMNRNAKDVTNDVVEDMLEVCNDIVSTFQCCLKHAGHQKC